MESLSKVQESDLRDKGFGYRARYITSSANQIMEKSKGKPIQWTMDLRKLSKKEAQQELLSLMGIGKKVAGD